MAVTTKLQGSLIIKEDVTIRIADSGGNGDMALTAGMEFDSVDHFLNFWQAFVRSGTGDATYTIAVVTLGATKGKIKISNAGPTISITWAQAGSSTEGARIRDFLGESGNVSGQATPYTFGAAHKAGFYPALGASALERTSTTYFRQMGMATDGSIWTQCDNEPVAEGNAQTFQGEGSIAIDIGLQIDGSTDWAELGDLAQFVDDVFDYMGQPWSVLHTSEGAGSADVFTGYFASSTIEIVGERVIDGWNGLLRVGLSMDGRAAPGLQA